MEIRTARPEDMEGLLTLYQYLNNNPFPVIDDRIRRVWAEMLAQKNQQILLCLEDDRAVSSLTLQIIPSLTHGQRPYALVEYVVTHPDFRGRGYARALLEKAVGLAKAAGCYKIMLVTGQSDPGVHRLYRRAGFSCEEKTAYVQALD